ncbi:MAG: ROK family protein, partial [Chloroflexi bacterium]
MTAQNRSNEKAQLLLGLDIGWTKTGLVLGDTHGQVMRRIEVPTPAGEPFEPAIEKISAAAEALLVECKVEGVGVPRAISVSVGGPLDIERGILFAPPHLAAWDEAPLKAQLEEVFG